MIAGDATSFEPTLADLGRLWPTLGRLSAEAQRFFVEAEQMLVVGAAQGQLLGR